MNISTYESRIKALEDQLNPPADPRTGIQSIVVTPDITLSDGTSLNTKLATLMPIAPTPIDSGSMVYVEDSNSNVYAETEYIITVTPGTDYYASYFTTQIEEASENPGDPITIRLTGNNYIEANFSATPTVPDEQNPPEFSSDIRITVGYIQ